MFFIPFSICVNIYLFIFNLRRSDHLKERQELFFFSGDRRKPGGNPGRERAQTETRAQEGTETGLVP